MKGPETEFWEVDGMNDCKIVDLFWIRSERAITETAEKYGKYCRSIAYNILLDEEDAEESVNDTYWGYGTVYRLTVPLSYGLF